MQQLVQRPDGAIGGGDLVGAYRIIRALHIGRSQVFLGEHARLGYPVALKVLAAGQSADAERGALNSLVNVYTPGLLDAGVLPPQQGGQPYIVTEYVPGETLQRLLQVVRRLSGARAARLGVHVLRALQYAHSIGLVHGDVKPENIVVSAERSRELRVSLIDYGEARSDRAGPEESGARRLATPHSAAPEVMRGAPAETGADIYGVGAVLYQCIAGRRPHDCAEGGAIVPLHEVVPVGRELSDVIARAMAESPRHRFPTAREFASRLEALPISEVQTLAVQGAVADGVQEAAATVEVGDEPTAAPAAALASRPWTGNRSALLSTSVPEVWAFRGDPGVDRPEVEAALANLQSECRVRFLDNDQRDEVRISLLSGAVPPSVMVFGDLHVLLSEPLLEEVSRQNETSMLLVSTHENIELLNSTVNACGLHHQVCLPAASEDIAVAIRKMLDRALRLRRRYDGLRLALRDAQEDLEKLRQELLESERT